MAKEKKAEPIEPIVEETAKVENASWSFVNRKLKAINAMQKPEKAEKLADRVLRKARN